MTYILPLRDSKTPLQKNVDAANPKVNKALHIQLNLNLIHLNLNLNPKPKVNAVLHIHLRTACLVIHCENILVRGGVTNHTQKTCVACMPGHTLVLALMQDWAQRRRQQRTMRGGDTLALAPMQDCDLIIVFSTGEFVI